jgi:saccharopine dehydrogenase-like NADP-dependent oxidoreductase
MLQKIDPLLKREQFAVTLRKQKWAQIIATKRKKIMIQKNEDNFESQVCVDYNGYPEFLKQSESYSNLLKDYNFP